MASPVYRGDDPGFQTQAVGNYPAKSDCADKDNIYLSDQGWVYRHFKNAAKTKYWDEVIWAGDVTNPPAENDPVDTFGAADPEFLVGDGYQFVTGVYPGVDPTIGQATISAPGSGDTGQTVAFTVGVAGTLANNNTYAWSVTGAGTAVISNATGTFTGNTANEANTNITFPTAGDYTVTCLIKSSATSSTGSIGTTGFNAIAPAADTIGTVSISGQATPTIGEAIVYQVSYTGDAPEEDVSNGWTANPAANVTFAAVPADKTKQTVTFTAASNAGVATEIKVVVNDADASDNGAFGTKSVTPHSTIGTPVLAGPTTVVKDVASAAFSIASYTGQSTPAPATLTYQWAASPSTGVTFSAATGATTTVTIATAGSSVVTCVVSAVGATPGSATSDSITLTAS